MEVKHNYIQIIRHNGDELGHYVDQDGQILQSFGPVSRVNIFVGATNSGKSRFMRGLAKNLPYKSVLIAPWLPTPQHVLNLCRKLRTTEFNVRIVVNPHSDPTASNQNTSEQVKSLWLARKLTNLKKNNQPHETNWNNSIFQTIETSLQELFTDFATGESQHLNRIKDNVDLIRFGLSELHDDDKKWCAIERNGFTPDIINDVEVIMTFVETLSPEIIHRHHPKQIIYIPVLRTAMMLKEISPKQGDELDRLANAIIANYNFRHEQPKSRNSKDAFQKLEVEVFTGNSLYWIVQRESTGEPTVKRRLKEFERFLQEHFFEDKTVHLSPLNSEHPLGQHLALFVNDQHDIPIKDWGDGIQAIIVMMYRVFTAIEGSWIFIEEPEQGLHPGLQRIFLSCLSNNKYLRDKDLTIFMTTHSNHLLGVALSELEDVSVFAFQERGFPGPFEVRPILTPDANLLKILGASNTSVFLANCGIWVEGITDRRYLRAFLAAYLESSEFTFDFKPREDIHFAFFEYAGSNLAHYLFETDNKVVDDIKARFLCNRIFLLADRDEGREIKHERLKAMQDDQFVYEITAGKEVENLISGEQLKAALPQLIRNVTEADIKELNPDDYHDVGLGHYLQRILKNKCPESLAADSGTLKDYYKNKMSRIVSEIVTWDNMSEDAKDLTRKLYHFIYKHNLVKSGK